MLIWGPKIGLTLRLTQVASYAFTFPDETNNRSQIRVMLPLLDLLNHGNEGVANSAPIATSVSMHPAKARLAAVEFTVFQYALVRN